MLTVDIDQLDSQLTKDRNGNQTSIYLADILAIQVDFSLNNGFTVIGDIVLCKPRQLGNIRKYCSNRCFCASRSDHVPVCTLAKNS